jgi:branched-chain amino acid transport system ATP-binding protein
MPSVSNLHTHYGFSHVIQGIELAARPREVVGVLGRNGVGKTTLIKTVAGWVKPTSGEIRLGSKRLDGQEPDVICHAVVGFVPENRRIFPGLTVQENRELGLLQVKGRAMKAGCSRIERIYGRFSHLGERRKQLGTTLSGGEQQMLAIRARVSRR